MKTQLIESLQEFINESKNSRKHGFHDNIEQDTIKNNKFRKVIYTGKHMQLVLMSLLPKENIGMEHHEADQFFRFESGKGQCIINGKKYNIKDGDSIFVPGGAEHDVINTSDEEDLKLYTLYGPPNHIDGIKANTKEDAEEVEKSRKDKFNGKTTE
jgi:mannose-6-phosphate isomerase-like protein (cupin superfamily)